MAEIISKLERIEHPEANDDNEPLGVIVKVFPGDYVPAAVVVRARISPNIFTCVVPRHLLATLEQDENVQSISVSRELHSY